MTKNKPSIFSIIFILFLIINYINFIKPIKKTKQAFYELTSVLENETDYNFYYIEFKNGINTKNFNEINKMFNNKDYEIIEVYTTPNKEYNEILQNKLKKYSFDNINNYIDYYINNLRKYNLYEQINNVEVFGIKINKILVYASKKTIKTISNENITYKIKKD